MRLRQLTILALTLLAFAANSILCRLALREGEIDAGSFTFVRLLSGAVALWLVVRVRAAREDAHPPIGGNWLLALFLFGYAAAFSFAYIDLNAATGGLMLFGCVQATMVILGLFRGERPGAYEWIGLFVAVGGLVFLLLPKAEAPSLFSGALMALAGVCWGCYSVYGKLAADPTETTAGNFARAVPMALAVGLIGLAQSHATVRGVALAIVSGAVTSGIGYVLWYQSLKWLTPTRAAVCQLTVPVIVVLAGASMLGEAVSMTLLGSGLLVVLGASLAIFGKSHRTHEALKT